MARRKKDIARDEFAGNYTLAFREELHVILGAYRDGMVGKDELRVFAAMLEHRALHKKSKVDMHRIVNANRSVSRSLSRVRIERIVGWLEELVAGVSRDGKRVAVSRRMMHYIARGRATCSEAVVLFYYCLRRIKQRVRRELLREGERYARIRYADVAKASGCARATLCRAVARLRWRGYLETVAVHKLNENREGGLYVDGPQVSLTCPTGRGGVRPPKATTPTAVSDNAPRSFSTTLDNKDPKTGIPNRRGHRFRLSSQGGVLVAAVVETPDSPDAEFSRIQQRARQMRESFADAIA